MKRRCEPLIKSEDGFRSNALVWMSRGRCSPTPSTDYYSIEMDRTVRSVPDRTMTVDRTRPDRGRTVDRTVAYHGPVQRWVGPPFAQKWTVPTRGPWTMGRVRFFQI
jgi:hypothetical protein